jgi:uncharacterized protein
VEPIEGGAVSERSVEPRAYGEFLARAFDRWLARRHVGEFFVRDFDSALASTMGVPGSSCVAAERCGRCVAIERTGDVFACDHFVDFGHRLGNVETGDLARMLDVGFAPEFGDAKVSQLPNDCRVCPQLALCHGGCPKDRIARTASGGSGLNYLCAGYRHWFAHARPVLDKMARCLRAQRPASDWRTIDASSAAGERNEACPCGSGKKHKRCCGK